MKNIVTSFIFAVIILCLIGISCTDVQSDTKIPRSVPEAEGISSKVKIIFPDCTATNKTEFHSFIVIRHGKVVAEG